MHVLRKRISACAESYYVLFHHAGDGASNGNEYGRARVFVMRVFMRFSFHCHTWRVWCRRRLPQQHPQHNRHCAFYVCVTENCDVAQIVRGISYLMGIFCFCHFQPIRMCDRVSNVEREMDRKCRIPEYVFPHGRLSAEQRVQLTSFNGRHHYKMNRYLCSISNDPHNRSYELWWVFEQREKKSSVRSGHNGLAGALFTFVRYIYIYNGRFRLIDSIHKQQYDGTYEIHMGLSLGVATANFFVYINCKMDKSRRSAIFFSMPPPQPLPFHCS